MSSISRRHLMLAATGIAAVAAAPHTVFAQAAAPAAAATGPFTLPPLTYPTAAFEPHIDAKTMEIHHDRHHQAFITNLNSLAKTNPQLATAARSPEAQRAPGPRTDRCRASSAPPQRET